MGASQAMSGSVLAQVLGLLVNGSASNWWGLGCPAHCSASLGLVVAIWVSGFSCGALAAVYYLRVLVFAGPPVSASASSRDPPVSRGRPPSTSTRLAAYRA